MSYQTISIQQSNLARIVTLNRPERRNAINALMMSELANALQDAASDGGCRAIIITGGPSFFSSGRDLKESAALKTAAEKEHARLAWRNLAERLEALAKPVIAAIEGYCLTGGLELALACDIRVAGEGASFGITSSRLGSVPGFGATQRLPRVVGMPKALELLFSADSIDTQEACRIGLISRAVARGGALAEAQAMADVYAERAPLSLARVKEAVRRGMQMDLAAGLDLEAALGMTLADTEDRKEGTRAFLEKRKPRFRGV